MRDEDVTAPEDGDIVTKTSGSGGISMLVEVQTPVHRQQLGELIEAYSDVFSVKPSQTNITEHCVDNKNAEQFKIPPYQVAKAWEQALRREITNMLA